MVVYESERVRRLIGRLDRGQELPTAFEDLARERDASAGWIRALGAFERVELCEYDQKARVYRPARKLDWPCEILSLEGNLSMKEGEPFAHLHATVSREVDGKVEVVGGHLVSGTVFACEFAVEIYDDVHLVREEDAATGLSLWEGSERAAPATTASGAEGVTWAQVADVSGGVASAAAPPAAHVPRRRRGPKGGGKLPPVPSPDPLPQRRRMSEEEFLETRHPERGDFIDHRQFGVCRVEGEDAEGGLRIRLPSGVRKVIRLDFLEVLAPYEDGGRRVYPVRPGRKR
ncbi:MAG: PPC domain-containing DNA-binding protein [Myxococcota bacterium]